MTHLVLVSDLHCGSQVGLLKPGVPVGKGNTIEFGDNICQEWLWNTWNLLWEKVFAELHGEPFVLVVNGDATEGIHHHSEEVIASAIDDHTAIATACLEPISKKAVKTFITAGTECHTRGMERVLAQKLKAAELDAKDEWLICVNGTLVEAKHHMPVTGRAYLEAGAMSITLGNARVNRLRAGHECPTVFLRAHRHCGGYFSDGQGLLAVAGGWQFLTRHGHKVVPESVPTPSLILLKWSEKNKLPTVYEYKMPQPQNKITTV